VKRNTRHQPEQRLAALETVRLVEVTVVLAIETYRTEPSPLVCGMDYLDVGNDAQLVGWCERELTVTPNHDNTQQMAS
jgi:hypothetical protein